MVLVWKVIKKPLSTDHNSAGLTAEKWDLCSNILRVVCSGALCDRWTNYGPGWAIYTDWDLDWWEPKCIEKPTLYGLNEGGLICVALACLYETLEAGEHFYWSFQMLSSILIAEKGEYRSTEDLIIKSVSMSINFLFSNEVTYWAIYSFLNIWKVRDWDTKQKQILILSISLN